MSANMISYILILLLFNVFTNIYAVRFFRQGRLNGGNLGSPELSNYANLPPEEWFVQLLDHFSPTNENTWQQRFYTNSDHFKPGGPVFIMIGGEGPISAKWMATGQWIEYAKQHNALCFQLEHRYYGKSHPTDDLSTEHLVYLSSEQALADLAYFITSMNKKYNLPDHTKWVAFGGSYPGSLSAWVRAKYPHLVHAAVSSSAPLLAEVDFKEYYSVVHSALATHSDKCVKSVQQGTTQVGILLRHMIGMRSINQKFRLCDPIEKSVDNSLDISNFYESLASNFAGVVQYNKDNRMGQDTSANITIDTVCDIMSNDTIGAAVDRLAAVNSILLDATKEKCLDYRYDNLLDEMRNASWDGKQSEGGRQWMYQTCTEFGFYQTSSQQNDDNLFGNNFPVDFFVQQCRDIFGPRYSETSLDAAVTRTNTFYGALNIESSRTVFVHGTIDPWHALGITESKSKLNPAILIEGTAHCANMYPARVTDLPQLTKARKLIGTFIKKWLQEY